MRRMRRGRPGINPVRPPVHGMDAIDSRFDAPAFDEWYPV